MTFPSIIAGTTGRRTALQLIQAAMGEIGMTRPTTIEGGDETSAQLLFLFNALGENLCRFPFFEELTSTYTITTTTATAYDLPADWGVPLAGTNWDRSGQWPLLGPKTPSEWQLLQSGFGAAAAPYRFRFFGGYFNLYPAPTAGLTLTMEYLSTFWVMGIGATAGTADTAKRRVTLDTDYCILDERMMIEGLKLAFKEEKGFDSTIQQRKWTDMMEAAWANSKGAPMLSMAPTSTNFLLTEYNAPDTGFGP